MYEKLGHTSFQCQHTEISMYLMNPNGWYCIHNKVNVMSKTEITLHCKAHLATTKDGLAVLAKDEKEQGVTVLGKATIVRKCE
jgi:hypothetical protein